MTNNLKALLLLSVIAVTLTGCSNKPTETSQSSKTASQNQEINNETDMNKILVEVDDKKISYGEYKKTFDRIYNTSEFGRGKVDLDNKENANIKRMFKDKTINDLITRHLIETEAKKRNIVISEAEVEDVFKKIILEVGGKEALETQLKLNNTSEAEIKASLKKDLIVNKVVEAMTKQVNVTDNEIQKYYTENKTLKFSHPDQVRASHIFIKASKNEITANLKQAYPTLPVNELDKKVEGEIEKHKTRAKAILKKVKNTPHLFAQVAQNSSEDPVSALKGGDLGFFHKSLMVKPFSDAAFKLTPGTVSDVVQSEFGFHIIKVTDRRKAATEPLSKVKDIIKMNVIQQKKFDIMQKFVNETKDKAKIVFMDEKYKPEELKAEKTK